MQLYPALRASMGTWTYYIAKMRMREIAAEVKFGSQVHNDYTLDEAIQRTLNESRVKREIVTYLSGRPDHFFSSLVVAAIGGKPKFFPVRVSDDPQFEVFAEEEDELDQSFGFLRFSGKQDYYALDGQHRLKAIKTILDPQSEAERVEPPPGFADEEVSVLMVIRPPDLDEASWLRSYRRLFSSLNRYAKPTDLDTNIIMDEDDAFAILTRRLVSEHPFFRSSDRHLESLRVQTKGRPLKEGTSHFTSLQQLYDLNEKLLSTHLRSNTGWGSSLDPNGFTDIKKFTRFRPAEAYLDALFEELIVYWDALIQVIPDLELNPADARDHQADGMDGAVGDNVLFWPIGQHVMISVARALLDSVADADTPPPLDRCAQALRPLGLIDWRLHAAPWRGLLLVSVLDGRSGTRRWAMRNESRKEAIEIAIRALRWMVGLSQLDTEEEQRLEDEWLDLLQLPPTEEYEGLWEKVRAVRDRTMAT